MPHVIIEEASNRGYIVTDENSNKYIWREIGDALDCVSRCLVGEPRHPKSVELSGEVVNEDRSNFL